MLDNRLQLYRDLSAYTFLNIWNILAFLPQDWIIADHAHKTWKGYIFFIYLHFMQYFNIYTITLYN